MADYDFVVTSGVILPDTIDLQTTVENEFRAVFGAALVVTPNTPQGLLITAEVLARAAVVANNAALANQINPNLAGGVYLDAIWALTGGTRNAATRSTIAGVQLAGVGGTLIPAGTLAATAEGVQFASDAAVTLDAGTGLASVGFTAVDTGPIACGVGALSVVVSGVLGWETVTNASAAVLGTDEESDGASRIRRRNTLALQSVSIAGSITSGLYATEGVRSLTFRENVTDATAVIDGVTLVEHSIWVCVDGGSDADIGAELLARKSMGAGYNGAVTVSVTDPASGQVYPVKFDRPTAVPVLARATVKVVGATGDPTELVKAAVVAYASGLVDGESGFTVGTSVSPFELAGAVNIQTPGIYVQKMEVAPVSTGVYVVAEIPLALNELATITAAGVSVVIV